MKGKNMRLLAIDLNKQGMQEIKEGNLDQAKTCFKQAIAYDSTLVESYQHMGEVCMQLADFVEAKHAYQQAWMLDPQASFLYAYGNACFMNGDEEEGLTFFHKAIQAGYKQEDLLFFMGQAHERRNEIQQALQCYQQACQQQPTNLVYRMRLIPVLIKADQDMQALEEIAVAKTMSNDSTIQRELLLDACEIYVKQDDIEHLKACVDECFALRR